MLGEYRNACCSVPGIKGETDCSRGQNRLRAVSNNRNFSIGTGTVDDADRLGKIWVGDGARPMKDVLGGLVSADGTRTSRPPQAKYSSFAITGIQANFQQFQNGQMISNGHLNVHR